jgi:hypothetical protein
MRAFEIARALAAAAVVIALPPAAASHGGFSPITHHLLEIASREEGSRDDSPRTKGTMVPDFSHALQANDRATLRTILDAELAKLDPKGDQQQNFQSFARWLEQQACVEKVVIEPGVLRSDPPIKVFTVTVKTGAKAEARSIGVRLSDRRYEFDAK